MDTSAAVEQVWRGLLASRTPAERLAMAGGMFATACQLARAGLLADEPGLSERQIRARLVERLYGAELGAETVARIQARLAVEP